MSFSIQKVKTRLKRLSFRRERALRTRDVSTHQKIEKGQSVTGLIGQPNKMNHLLVRLHFPNFPSTLSPSLAVQFADFWQ
jgi:hypothetical protein